MNLRTLQYVFARAGHTQKINSRRLKSLSGWALRWTEKPFVTLQHHGRSRPAFIQTVGSKLKMNTKRTYHPWNAKAQTWDYIENRYMKDWQGKHGRLLDLVRHIKNSDYQGRLFGSTSMDKLVVSIYDPIDYRKEALHITFDLWSRKWRFEYITMPFKDPEFVRTYDEVKGIEKFDNFIKMIRW